MCNIFEKELQNLKKQSRFRQIKNIGSKNGKYINVNGKNYLNLSSNDYLGIAGNKDLTQMFLKENKDFSFGSASSRLLTGNLPLYKELEALLARLHNKDGALLFNSGYHANIGIISALAQKDDIVFSDKLNHASIIDGLKLSDGKFYRYKHLNYEHLESLLKKHRTDYNKAFIMSETVFSMDGDITDLHKLIELKNKYRAFLIIDEAHAFGAFGQNKLGICEEQNVINETDIITGTFGKSIGSIGAYCVASQSIIDYLINTTRSFIFTTALPDVNIMFSKWVIEKVLPDIDTKKLFNTASKLRNVLAENKIKTCGQSQIVPVMIGDNLKTVQAAEHLQSKGYYVLPIRPPTVAPNTSRLRFSLTADIEWDDIKDIPNILKEVL